ncbi:MAG: CerR family C-terminal domain-containing protein [Planctomycetota bacterium]
MSPPDPTRDADTRHRLLAAAGEEFSRVGFRAANVRDICAAAEANVAAVNYHFGSKEALYRQVWEHASRDMVAAEPMPTLAAHADPAEALTDFMRWFMRLVLIEGTGHTCAGSMLAQEAAEPTGALSVFVEHGAAPIRKELRRIVSAILGRGANRRVVDDLTNAVIALCVNPKHSSEILTRLGFPPPTTAAAINRMAERLADFALHGLIGLSPDAPTEEP